MLGKQWHKPNIHGLCQSGMVFTALVTLLGTYPLVKTGFQQ